MLVQVDLMCIVFYFFLLHFLELGIFIVCIVSGLLLILHQEGGHIGGKGLRPELLGNHLY